ncbi:MULTISPECIES: ABC transporter ATP-binding protein [Bacillus cereus group]|uniref:ATP-binding cassette domain-containing protein n=1 Tax=Bacillus cereus group TaxID=86661 RepID=UPI000CD91770|nr:MULTISPECIES: ABC transporter ATP-binding protein [Bacillus cereus group]MBG9832092.1 ABC transporter [Bacillus wiedmannii]MED3079428.1 ABC transporter ATP-binding protein [Bacillus wiedmannii]UOB98532.1 ABC-type transporter ATP-binding protein EcsA [Bacillus wiedmannii]
MLYIQNLNFRYDKNLKLLENISFSANPSDIIWLKGDNGCGKTTLLRIIAQLINTESEISFKGKLIENRKELLANLTYIPAEPYLFNYLTGAENADFFQQLFHIDQKQFLISFLKMIYDFQMDHALGQFVQEYSLGMKHKLYWSAVLARKSSIILLDEPLSSFDSDAQKLAINILKQKASEGSIILFTSHLSEISAKLATRILVLHEGNLKEEKL